MTFNFDKFCESMIREYTTAKSKRRESRYFKDHKMPDAITPRAIRMPSDVRSASQETKVGNTQQYVGNYWDIDGVRGRNKSEKSPDQAGIANGIGGYLKVTGVNPKKPGARVNSKQGNMEIKYTTPGGRSKVGPRWKTDFTKTEKLFGGDRN